MICLMPDAMLRVSEAAAVKWEDIEVQADGTERLMIRRSRTDPEREGAIAFISRLTMKSLNTIRNGTTVSDSAFGLRTNQISRRIKQAAWAAKMKRLLCNIKDEVASTSALHTTLPPDRLSYYEAEYDALIAQGFAVNPATKKTKPKPIGRPKQSPPKNLLDRLHKRKTGVLAFMYDFRIPFDNNQVERDVRMIKVQQKVSGCFRTQDGAHLFCALRSYISTARKHGLNAIDAIYNAFLDQPFIPDTNQA